MLFVNGLLHKFNAMCCTITDYITYTKHSIAAKHMARCVSSPHNMIPSLSAARSSSSDCVSCGILG